MMEHARLMTRRTVLELAALLARIARQQMWVYEVERNQRIMMRYARVAIMLIVIIQVCTAQQSSQRRPVFMLRDFMKAKVLLYDSPPQVIYRIDDYRFATLEHYRDCYHGEAYYNDTRTGIRTSLGRTGVESFQGRLINADPTGRNLAFAWGGPPQLACPDKGCGVPLLYSTDGGKTFHGMVYMRTSYPFEYSKRYAIYVTIDSLFFSKKISETANSVGVDRYPLIPGFAYDGKEKLRDGKSIELDAMMPRGLRTFSGEDRITCDPSIKPTNPDAPLMP